MSSGLPLSMAIYRHYSGSKSPPGNMLGDFCRAKQGGNVVEKTTISMEALWTAGR